MFNKKAQIAKIGCVILSILFFNNIVFASDLKTVNLDLTKKTIEQKTDYLLAEDSLKDVKTTASFKDLDEIIDQADQLCNDLKKQLSLYFKLWSKISRNPVFENQLSESIEKLQHQLLLYHKSEGKEGKTFSKEKLVELVALMSKYKKLKTSLNEKAIFINYFEQSAAKSLSNGFSWIGKKIKPALDMCLTLTFFVPLCAAFLGIAEVVYFRDLYAFFKPFGFLKGVWELIHTVGKNLSNGIEGANKVSDAFSVYIDHVAYGLCWLQRVFGGSCILNTK